MPFLWSWAVYLTSCTSFAMTKEEVIEAMNALPENFDLDALGERLIYVEKVEEGFAAIERGEFKTHEEVEVLVKSWRK
jgi:hypothetical protein